MKIIKFETVIFNDKNKTNQVFYNLLFKQIDKSFKKCSVLVVFSSEMMLSLGHLKCTNFNSEYKNDIEYQVVKNINENVKIHDIFIYEYYENEEFDNELSGRLVTKYYRKEKLKQICLNQEIE